MLTRSRNPNMNTTILTSNEHSDACLSGTHVTGCGQALVYVATQERTVSLNAFMITSYSIACYKLYVPRGHSLAQFGTNEKNACKQQSFEQRRMQITSSMPTAYMKYCSEPFTCRMLPLKITRFEVVLAAEYFLTC